jgi:hypothetical protein
VQWSEKKTKKVWASPAEAMRIKYSWISNDCGSGLLHRKSSSGAHSINLICVPLHHITLKMYVPCFVGILEIRNAKRQGHTSITGHFTTRVSICWNRIAHAQRLTICHYVMGVATQILLKQSINNSVRPCIHFISVNTRFWIMLHTLQTVS